MATLTAKLCAYHDLMLIYMHPSDVDIEKHKVKGKIYLNDEWEEVEVDIPKFIDISPYCFKRKNREIIRYLKERTQLSDERKVGFGKERLQTYLKGTNDFKQLVIPTLKVNSFRNIEYFVNQYNTIVMKPLGGERGKGVYILTKKDNEYLLGYQKKEKLLSLQDLNEFFEEKLKNKRYILQKCIRSRTIQGDPFDCRIHMEKNGDGKWVNAKNYIRIGIGQKVISNVSQGGGISELKPFLEANFGAQSKDINIRINKLAESLPYQLEKLRENKMMTMGMDIGIDKDGSLYLFEVNSAPITNPLRDIVVKLRVDYYTYMLGTNVQNNFLPINTLKLNEQLDDMKKKNEKLKKENKRLKKNYNKIENSTSWKITRPIRSIGKLIKRL